MGLETWSKCQETTVGSQQSKYTVAMANNKKQFYWKEKKWSFLGQLFGMQLIHESHLNKHSIILGLELVHVKTELAVWQSTCV